MTLNHYACLPAVLFLGLILSCPAQGETWTQRAPMIEPNSEFAVAEAGGQLFILGGYPATRITVATVQIYDAASDSWTLGPPLPVPLNHGMAASVNGIVYHIGGQTEASGTPYVDHVLALDPATGIWERRAPMPTARSAGVAVVHQGLIYVAGGRPPRGHDFAVYDPASDRWEALPDLPSQRNHIAGGALNGRIHIVGGRLGGGFRSDQTAAHEVFDPATRTWSVASPMLRPRSGHNAVVANGCLHAWGGESAAGMFADHDYFDPRSSTWTRLADMPIPIHGVVGSAFLNGQIHAPGGGTQVGGSSGSLLNQVFRPTMTCE